MSIVLSKYGEKGPAVKRTLGKLKAGEHVTIVALGDSNTEITFHLRGHLNWVGLLSEALFAAYGAGVCTMVNAGQCGSTARESLGRLDRDVLRFRPDLTILSLGLNDAGRGLGYLDEFRAQMREIIARVRKECGGEILIRTPNPVVTANGLPRPPEQPHPGKVWEAPDRPVKEYSQALVDLARQEDCPVVDHYSLWAGYTCTVRHRVADPNGLWPRMSDGAHPGPLGHLCFLRELAPFFEVPPYFPWEGLPDRYP
jgi:lysophospholipase L1-like esterase